VENDGIINKLGLRDDNSLFSEGEKLIFSLLSSMGGSDSFFTGV